MSNITLTPMQEAAGKAISNGRNVQLLSPTGSGKTLAFLLPIISRLVKNGQIQAVIIVPSRELALQIENVFKTQMKTFDQAAKLPVGMALYGGRPAMEEHRTLREVLPEIIFATPGRILDHIGKGNIDISKTQVLVIDEYDKCLELGFREEMVQISESFRFVRQFVLTSATATDEDSPVLQHRQWITLDYTADSTLDQRLTLKSVVSPERDKVETLARLLSSLGTEQSIVFVAHRESAERIANLLNSEKFSCVVYHGGMEQDRRERALYRFRAAAATTLVSTDLAARGLDIPGVRHIIHYHLPLDEAAFTHRSGRTARWEDHGTAYLILGPDEHLPAFITDDIETLDVQDFHIRPRQPKWTLLYIGRGKKDKLSKADILGFLCKKGSLNTQQIGRIDLAAHAAYVAVERSAVKHLLQLIGNEKIKKMKTIIEPLRH